MSRSNLSRQSHNAPGSGRPLSLRAVPVAAALAGALLVSGCLTKTTTHGYVFTQNQIDQIPVGASREQVAFVLGTPSTTGSFDGLTGDVHYYIAQTTETTAFLAPEVVDQRVLAVYFDQDDRVSRVADYGLQDGQVFDFINRTTPTSGAELTLLRQIMEGTELGNPGIPGGGGNPQSTYRELAIGIALAISDDTDTRGRVRRLTQTGNHQPQA